MSTYWYYECLDHTPALRSEEFTQHSDDRHFQRGIELVKQRPVERDDRYWSIHTATDEERTDAYFTMRAKEFLHLHPSCRIELVSENGERRDADGSNPRWETSPDPESVDIAQLVRDLIDPDDCWFDHNGGCQAHGYLSLEPGELCPHAEAKAWLKGIGR